MPIVSRTPSAILGSGGATWTDLTVARLTSVDALRATTTTGGWAQVRMAAGPSDMGIVTRVQASINWGISSNVGSRLRSFRLTLRLSNGTQVGSTFDTPDQGAGGQHLTHSVDWGGLSLTKAEFDGLYVEMEAREGVGMATTTNHLVDALWFSEVDYELVPSALTASLTATVPMQTAALQAATIVPRTASLTATVPMQTAALQAATIVPRTASLAATVPMQVAALSVEYIAPPLPAGTVLHVIASGGGFALSPDGPPDLVIVAGGGGFEFAASGTPALRFEADGAGNVVLVAAPTTVPVDMEAAATGAGTGTAALEVSRNLSGAATASGVTTAALEVARQLGAAAMGVGASTAALEVTRLLGAAAVGSAHVEADLEAPGAGLLTVHAEGSGVSTAEIEVTRHLSAAAVGVATVTADISVDIVALEAAAIGAGIGAASLEVVRGLAATAEGAGIVTAQIGIVRELTAAATGSGVATAVLEAIRGLAASAVGVGVVEADLERILTASAFRLYLDTDSGSVIPTIGPHPTFIRSTGAPSVDMAGRSFLSLPHTPRYVWGRPRSLSPRMPAYRRAVLLLEKAKTVGQTTQAREELIYPGSFSGAVALYVRGILMETGAGNIAWIGNATPSAPYLVLALSVDHWVLTLHNGSNIGQRTVFRSTTGIAIGAEFEIMGLVTASELTLTVSINGNGPFVATGGLPTGGLPGAYSGGLVLNGASNPWDRQIINVKEVRPGQLITTGADQFNEVRRAVLSPAGDIVSIGG